MMSKFKTALKWIIGGLAILYIVLLAAVYFLQRDFIYNPPKEYIAPDAMQLGMDEVDIGNGSMAWWAPPQPGKRTVIMFHGNASAIYSDHKIFQEIIAQGNGLMSVGYAGYPGQPGKATEKAIVADAIPQYDWVVSQGVDPRDIAFLGTSLGSGVASQVSVQREPALLILGAPFESTYALGKERMPIFPVKLLMKDKWRSDLALRGKKMPLVWIHGTDDHVIPIKEGRRLYDEYTGPKSAFVIEGGHHDDLWQMGGREIVFDALDKMTSPGAEPATP
ncbi:alpha/beta hydrolase [Hellea sp.]|nr:alpha/beta hydrolase [Hellea sp.]